MKTIDTPNFYKYCSFTNHCVANFENEEIWGTVPEKFNDTLDTVACYSKEKLNEDIRKIYAQYHFHGVSLRPQDIERLVKETETSVLNWFDGFFKKVYASCFSERVDISSMWAHYAQCGRGFALSYTHFTIPSAALGKITYSDFRSDLTPYFSDVAKLVCYIVDAQIKKGAPLSEEEYQAINQKIKRNNEEEILLKFLFTKDKSWMYEKEWRISVIREDETNDHTMICNSKPTALFLGQKMFPRNRNRLIKIAKKKGIPVYQMETVVENNTCYLKPFPVKE